MCARIIYLKLAGTWQPGGLLSSPADVGSSSRASYRVLRSGRQRPWRSVNRETTGRNVSAPIEPRHMLNRVWVSSLYGYGEDHASGSRSWRPIGVRVDSMLSKLEKRTEEIQIRVEKEYEVKAQEVTFKDLQHTLNLEVRWSHNSWEVE